MAEDPGCVWAYGKVEPGWYCARWIWNEGTAQHLRDLGYQVMQSKTKPEVRPDAA